MKQPFKFPHLRDVLAIILWLCTALMWSHNAFDDAFAKQRYGSVGLVLWCCLIAAFSWGVLAYYTAILLPQRSENNQ